MTADRLSFAVPGALATLTGGFLYDRRMIEGLGERGWEVEPIELPEGFPLAGPGPLRSAEARLRAVPDGRRLVVDGLAAGVLPEAMAALARRLPLALLIHHPLAAESGLTEAQAGRLRDSERASLAAAQRVIATSKATAAALRRDYGVPAERLFVAQPGTAAAPLARGSGGSVPSLLCVGSLIPRKGQDLLIEALAALAGLPWRLVLAGGERDAGYAGALRARAAEAGLATRILFAGEIPPERLTAFYAEADLFVLPSRLEGYGMAIAEALARGLPVLCSTSAAIVEELPADSLAAVPPDDLAALCSSLRGLLEAPDRRHALAVAARRARRQLPTWAQAVAGFEKALA